MARPPWLPILTNSGVYGNNNSGSVDIGNGSQTNAIYVGSEGGSLTVAAFDVNLEEGAGVPVQLGYHGNGGGNIVVDATDDLTLTADNTSNQGYVLIGNGDFLESDSSITSVTGNITVKMWQSRLRWTLPLQFRASRSAASVRQAARKSAMSL